MVSNNSVAWDIEFNITEPNEKLPIARIFAVISFAYFGALRFNVGGWEAEREREEWMREETREGTKEGMKEGTKEREFPALFPSHELPNVSIQKDPVLSSLSNYLESVFLLSSFLKFYQKEPLLQRHSNQRL